MAETSYFIMKCSLGDAVRAPNIDSSVKLFSCSPSPTQNRFVNHSNRGSGAIQHGKSIHSLFPLRRLISGMDTKKSVRLTFHA